MLNIKTGLYRFRVTLSNGKIHETFKVVKTSKGASWHMTKFANLICKQTELDWVTTEWKFIKEEV